ncbi:Protein of unknown function [Prosthecobacter debontii]|uniref:Tat (Twin-arginine translocation) pathway signal sequence n=1 Tax=Prosthecobacter debontii TaxID=48467 RepID=A0A1T4YP91_9BACT|nr:DUF1501 domain-containing protein [Prosthecobacter debontii]SKB03654.1 Protein of unknown function [Prosthecobacter debontii]
MRQELTQQLLQSGEISRREFAAKTASSLLGVGLLGSSLQNKAFAAFENSSKLKQVATAKNVIYLYMSGGQSHMDTWDPKEGVETAGPTKPIKTSADGVRISEYLPLTAQQMHHACVINSLTSTQGAHEQGNYMMHTSYDMRGTIRHPAMGAWLNVFQGGGNSTLPNFVFIGNDSRHPGAGFFPAQYSPLYVSNPENGLKNVKMQPGLTEDRFMKRMNLADQLDQDFRSTFPQRNVKAYSDMYDDAMAMMKSEDLKAFDLTEESEDLRKAYGKEAFGQGCLLARRLVERGVRFVEVSLGGWDTHNANFVRVPELCATLDRGLGTLLQDLNARGLLEETLVVVTSEFGRTPDINQNVGRDHYPKAFSAMMAGGGISGGMTYGKTDNEGREVVEDKVQIADMNATIAYALGLPLDQVIYSPSKRPFTIADKGKPLVGIFA